MQYLWPQMESERQKKFAALIQKDLAEILQRAAQDGGLLGTLISVSKVRVTVDLSIAKVYLSIFPSGKAQELVEGIKSNAALIKHEVAQRTRHQIRRMPELLFFVDDSLDYMEKVNRSLKGEDNPLKNPELLAKRKKK